MATLHAWLAQHADSLDRSADQAEALLPALAGDNLFAIGVPRALGGAGGDTRDAVLEIAAVAQQSLTAAFVFWGQRTFIEYLLQSPNAGLAERRLPDLLRGARAGATGLSNAMKFLSGIEQLQIAATPREQGWQLDGALPWVTNLRRAGFSVAAAVAPANGAAPAVVLFDSDMRGVRRDDDLDLIALRGSNTASIKIDQVRIGPEHLLSGDAQAWLPAVRPAFLGMQCGMSIGLARASLEQAAAISAGSRNQLTPRIARVRQALATCVDTLLAGIDDGRFAARAAPLFRLRIELAELVQQALTLELQAMGGRAYLRAHQNGFARRWNEAAFIPVVTPSLTQLQAALSHHDGTAA